MGRCLGHWSNQHCLCRVSGKRPIDDPSPQKVDASLFIWLHGVSFPIAVKGCEVQTPGTCGASLSSSLVSEANSPRFQ